MTEPHPAAGGRPSLAVFLLGPLRAEAGALPLQLRSRKARATLGYLALAPAAEETREGLAALLWSEVEEDKARASLRQVVRELAAALQRAGCGGQLRAGRLTLGLDATRLANDLAPVLADAEAGRAHPRLLEAPGLPQRLLEGLEDLDPCFHAWVLARRQALQDRLLRLLEPRLRAASGGAEARALALAILGLDASHEEACRALMATAAAAGDVAGALGAYERLRSLLATEYATRPAAATEALAATIEAPAPAPGGTVIAAGPASDGAGAGGAPPRLDTAGAALLVEPFGLNGVPPARAHLVEGLRQALTDGLARLGARPVAEGPAPVDRADPWRGAGHRLAATAYQAGDRISLMLTLAAPAPAGGLLWSERVELGPEGWSATHRHLLRQLAEGLEVPLSAALLRRLADWPETLRAALDPWLRGQAAISSGSWESGLALLRKAAAAAPGFAPARAALAHLLCLEHLLRPGLPRSAAREAAALDHARRAVALDPADARSQRALGWSLALAGRHGPAALPMRLALELAPGDGATLLAGALFHACCGEHAAAMALGRRAQALTPAPTAAHWAGQAVIAGLAGEDAAALQAAMQAGEALPPLLGWRAAALARLGRRAEARALAERFVLAVRADWHGEAAGASPGAVARWLLAGLPLRRAADWAALREGLALAGLPTQGAAHGRWYDSGA